MKRIFLIIVISIFIFLMGCTVNDYKCSTHSECNKKLDNCSEYQKMGLSLKPVCINNLCVCKCGSFDSSGEFIERNDCD